MLKSCRYCGRIHDGKYDCGKKPHRFKKKYEKDSFRSSSAWQRKAEEIKERDNHLCQICIRNLYGTVSRLNSTNLSVHHAVPLKINYELRLDNSNLITLCGKHHEMAEKGVIPLDEILNIVRQQDNIPPG
ncbi:HNH endonuclease [Lachnospiraceae bacterium 54-11]